METANPDSSSVLSFKYYFYFENSRPLEFDINLDLTTLSLIHGKKELPRPFWAKLAYHQCDNCPLDEIQHPYCPLSLNITELLECFKSYNSYVNVEVAVATPQRNYSKKTTIQQGLGSMLGIFMVTSGCPIMEKLKPMVRFHLPFASVEETLFRATSIYLLGQYFCLKKGLKADLSLNQLRQFYLEIQKVNRGIVNRLMSILEKDAFANAIISLDTFAKELPWSIEEQLAEIEYLFAPYFNTK